MSDAIIYVPGLGDKKRWLLWLQQQTLRLWRRRGLHIEMLPMRWSDEMPLKPRFNKLLERIDELECNGHTVSLVGTSAGASAVVSALSLRPKTVHRVVTICGKLQGDIPDTIKDLNPCFAESLKVLARQTPKLTAVQKQRILTLRSPWDPIVPPAEAVVDGAQNRVIKCLGHNPTCAYILLCRGRLVTKFVRG